MRAVPHLMFQGERDAALALWTKAFGDLDPQDRGSGVTEITIAGQKISTFDSPPAHDFSFTPSFSLLVDADSADDVDRLAAVLGEGGDVMMPLDTYDFADRFAWIEDPFGISWQLRFGAK